MNFAIAEQWNVNWNLRTKHTLHGHNRSIQNHTRTFPRAGYQNIVFTIFSVIVGAAVSFDMSRGAHGFLAFNAQTTQTFICRRNLSVLSFMNSVGDMKCIAPPCI